MVTVCSDREVLPPRSPCGCDEDACWFPAASSSGGADRVVLPRLRARCSFMQDDDSSCLYKYDFKANDLPQRVHAYGLKLECVWTCARRFDLSAKALPHMLHRNGFSPVQVKQQIIKCVKVMMIIIGRKK